MKIINKCVRKVAEFLLDLSTRNDPKLAGRDRWLRANLRPKNFVKGEKHPSAKLSWQKVEAIRTRYAKGGISHETLAREYDVSASIIGKIIRGQLWKAKDAPGKETAHA